MPSQYTKTFKPPKQYLDLTGQQFGRLTVVRLVGTQNRKYIWECACICGNVTYSATGDLRNQKRTSCGCGRRKHMMSYTSVYGTWIGMLQRCYNPTNVRFSNYGARGITVCARWRESFENFYADMGDPSSPSHSIDRIDNNGNYELSNCRWGTRSEQQRNKRDTRMLTVNGVTKPMIDWAESDSCQVSYPVLHARITSGWNIDDALNIPLHRWNPARRSIKP